jgi:hypothetical protein
MGALICLALRSAAASCGRLPLASAPFLDLDKLPRDLQRLGGGEPGDGLPLRFKAEAGLALFVAANPDVGDDWCWHGRSITEPS